METCYLTSVLYAEVFMLFLLFGCLTGNNYPTQLANAACKTGYACLDPDQIEDFLGYENIEECISKTESDTRSSDSFKDFEAGSKDFNKENAELCLSEVLEVQQDSDCDGEMDVFSFFGDIYTEECFNVYE